MHLRILGGSSLYIPNDSSLVKSFRNKKIREDFNGDYKAISRKFGISEVQVRNIINLKQVYLILELADSHGKL